MESPLGLRSPLSIERRYNENEPAATSQTDVIISATQVKDFATTLAEAGEGENLRIEHLVARNTTMISSTLRIYLVPDGATAILAQNAFIVRSVAGGATVRLDEVEGYQLAPGEKLQAFCSPADDFIIAGRLTRITQGR